MSKPVQRIETVTPFSKFSQVTESEQKRWLNACRSLTNDLYSKLDLEREIRAVHNLGLGETILLWDDRDLLGFAVCHCGPGTEAGNNKCYIKFGAVQQVSKAEEYFDQLLDACEELTVNRGMQTLEAGLNMARLQAYRKRRDRGFRSELQGVTMHRPNEPGYNRPDSYIIDDWR